MGMHVSGIWKLYKYSYFIYVSSVLDRSHATFQFVELFPAGSTVKNMAT